MERLNFCIFFDVFNLMLIFVETGCKTEIDKADTRSFIEVPICVNHYVFLFYIIESPPGSMNVLEYAHKLFDYLEYATIPFSWRLEMVHVLFEVHLVHWH